MRQLLSVRLAAALAALLLLTLAVNATFGADGDVIEAVVDESTPPDRRIDLIALVEGFERSEDFAVTGEGVTAGFLDVVLDADRVVRVAPGTPGEIRCRNLENPNRCVVFADLLGDAVIWFAVEPRAPRDTVRLPPVVDLQDGYAILENGWQIKYPPIIERDCPEEADITSFSDFLRRFGPGSTSIVELEAMMVTAVECGEEFTPPPTTVPDDAITGSLGNQP